MGAATTGEEVNEEEGVGTNLPVQGAPSGSVGRRESVRAINYDFIYGFHVFS